MWDLDSHLIPTISPERWIPSTTLVHPSGGSNHEYPLSYHCFS